LSKNCVLGRSNKPQAQILFEPEASLKGLCAINTFEDVGIGLYTSEMYISATSPLFASLNRPTCVPGEMLDRTLLDETRCLGYLRRATCKCWKLTRGRGRRSGTESTDRHWGMSEHKARNRRELARLHWIETLSATCYRNSTRLSRVTSIAFYKLCYLETSRSVTSYRYLHMMKMQSHNVANKTAQLSPDERAMHFVGVYTVNVTW